MNVDIVNLLIIFVVILVSMTLHEAMHAYASFWLGDDTAKLSGRLTLNPIKHIDPVLTLLLPILLAVSGAPIFGGAKPVPINSSRLKFEEWGMALVALAGPLTNFAIAFLSIAVLALFGIEISSTFGQIILTIASVNLGFFVFNMIPIPPLDGSRVIYALAPEFVRRGMEAIERFGIIFVFIFVLMAGAYLGRFMIIAINFFLNLLAGFFGV